MEMGQVEQIIQDAELYTCLEKIDRTVGITMESMGLTCRLGDVYIIDAVEGRGPVMTETMGFRESRVLLMPYEEMRGISYGSAVCNTGERLRIAISDQLIGRMVDAVGMSIDGLRSVGDVSYYTIAGKFSSPMTRPRINAVIQMGVKATSGLLTVGKGQRVGVSTGSDVGKSTLMSIVAKDVKTDTNVIALVGERSRRAVELINRNLGEEELKRSVLAVTTSSQLVMMRSKCTTIATTIAEYLRDQGMDVLLMMDSLACLAMAQREVGLSTGEPPMARRYTPSIYPELPRLLERSGDFEEGPVMETYTVLVEGDDANKPISDTVRGIIDGHIILSRKVAAKNRYPAVDILPNIDRLMNDIVMPEHREATGKLRRLLAVYESNSDLVSIGAYKKGANPKLDDALVHMDWIYGFFQQKTDESLSLDETAIQMIQATD